MAVAADVSAAETTATAINRTERPSRTIDGALLLKRPITHHIKPSCLTIAFPLSLVPFPA